jgi:ATP-dependent NAD(P)H-hydrate dehydratase
MQNYAFLAASLARAQGMFIVLDADALWLLGQDLSMVKGYRRAVITPNVAEFNRLAERLKIDPNADEDARAGLMSRALGGVTVLQKGKKDTIAIDTIDGSESSKVSADGERENIKEVVHVSIEGGMKRCGGQGDILSGAVGTILAWGRCYEQGAFG